MALPSSKQLSKGLVVVELAMVDGFTCSVRAPTAY